MRKRGTQIAPLASCFRELTVPWLRRRVHIPARKQAARTRNRKRIDKRKAHRPGSELLPTHLHVARVARTFRGGRVRLQIQPIGPRRVAPDAEVTAKRVTSKLPRF